MPSKVLVAFECKPDRLTISGLEVIKQALVELGCNSVTAGTLDNALNILQKEKISAVICTLGLYDDTAFDLFKRAQRQNLVTMPFIIITVSQSFCQDDILTRACEGSGASYMNLGRFDSTREVQDELKKRLLLLR